MEAIEIDPGEGAVLAQLTRSELLLVVNGLNMLEHRPERIERDFAAEVGGQLRALLDQLPPRWQA